jgi:hypothetical protein
MAQHRSWVRVAASLLVVASLLAACGGTQAGSSAAPGASRGPTPVPTPETLSAYPDGFPTTWTNLQNPPDTRLIPVAGGLQGNLTGTLTADDGSQATYTATWVENRAPAANVDCNGVNYTNVYIGTTPEVTSEVKFAGWGSATLVTVGHVTVYRSSRNGSSPSICDQSTVGTFTAKFTKGGVTQLMSGTWHFDKDGHLVFDAPAAGSPAPS